MSLATYLVGLNPFKRKAIEAIPFSPSANAEFGPGIGNQPDADTLLRESLGVSDMATRAIANRLATLNPLVKTSVRIRDGTTVEETIDDHPMKALLDRPHPNIPRSQLLRLAAQWVITVGAAHWLKVGNRLQVPMRLHPIPPSRITPIIAQDLIAGYRVFDGDGRPHTIAADAVIRFWFPDPENLWGGEGYLGPMGVTADSSKFAGQHLRRHYQHDATPKTALEAGPDAVAFTSPEERERFLTQWTKLYHNRSGTNHGAPGITPAGYKLIQLALQSGADVTPLLEHWRDEQLMGFGVPRSILGQVVSGDRSSAETNQYVFDRHTILPIATMMAEALTLQLAPDFDPALTIEFEEFVSADKGFRLAEETADLTGKVRSVNQVRQDRGLDPVDWGEEPVATLGQVPYDPEGFSMDLAPDDSGAITEEPEEEEEERTRTNGKPRAALYFNPDHEWERQIVREKKYVPLFLRAMQGILAEQKRSVLAKLEAMEPRELEAMATRLKKTVFAARAAEQMKPIEEQGNIFARISVGEVFDPEEWRELFEKKIDPIREEAFRRELASALAGFGLLGAFEFTPAMAETLKRYGAQLVKHANRTTQEYLARTLSEGTLEGESLDQLAKRVRSVFKTRRKHARTIARTEVLKASQTAQLESYEVADIEEKQWFTARDPDVRDDHRIEGQIVARGEPFILGNGEAAAAPGIGFGGTNLSAGNAINCRCYVLPVED